MLDMEQRPGWGEHISSVFQIFGFQDSGQPIQTSTLILRSVRDRTLNNKLVRVALLRFDLHRQVSQEHFKDCSVRLYRYVATIYK